MAQSSQVLAGGWKTFSDLFCNKLPEKGRNFLKKHVGADLIIVCGPTGVGKSSFIKSITGKDVYVGSTLVSGTRKTALVPAIIGGKRYLFLDMPGFNADDLNDWDVFHMLMTALVTVRPYTTFRGVLYIDSLNDRRLTGPGQKLLTWLSHFCGLQFMPNVTLITTMWDGLNDDGIEDKLNRYKLWHDDQLSGRFFSHGAKVYHHGLVKEQDRHRTLHVDKQSQERSECAKRMITAHYGDTSKLTLLVADEIAAGRSIEETSAGSWLQTRSTEPKGCADNSNGFESAGRSGNTRKASGFFSQITFQNTIPWIRALVGVAKFFMAPSSSRQTDDWVPTEEDMFGKEIATPSASSGANDSGSCVIL